MNTTGVNSDDAGRRQTLEKELATMGEYLTTIYGFDDANRLLTMLHTNPVGTVEDISYTYDPDGNRRVRWARPIFS